MANHYNITTVLGTPIVRIIDGQEVSFKRLRLSDMAELTEAIYAKQLEKDKDAKRMNILQLRNYLVFDTYGMAVVIRYAAIAQNSNVDLDLISRVTGDVVQLAAEIVGVELMPIEPKDDNGK